MNNNLNIIVDGIVYIQQSHGGISRIYSEILPRMCVMEESLMVTLIIQDENCLSLPSHANISLLRIPIRKPSMRWIFFWDNLLGINRYLLIKQRTFGLKKPIWHSTYFTTAGRWNGPVVLTVHDMMYERFPTLFNTSYDDYFRIRKRKCIENSDAIICNSETTRNDLDSFCQCKDKSIYVIPLAYSNIFKRLNEAEFKRNNNKPFLLYIGGRGLYKNFSIFIQAYQKWKISKDVDLVVVGAPWTSEEQQLLANLCIMNRIHLFTNISDEELCKLYNETVAFIYPSLFEGFGIPLLEAMACGCPIVASNIPSTIEVAGNFPFYFEPTNIDGLIEALDRVIDEERDSSRILSGLEIVKKYSWDKTAQATLEVYRSFAS